ncbi:unnamed protein product, partial [Brassica oleracea]
SRIIQFTILTKYVNRSTKKMSSNQELSHNAGEATGQVQLKKEEYLNKVSHAMDQNVDHHTHSQSHAEHDQNNPSLISQASTVIQQPTWILIWQIHRKEQNTNRGHMFVFLLTFSLLLAVARHSSISLILMIPAALQAETNGYIRVPEQKSICRTHFSGA